MGNPQEKLKSLRERYGLSIRKLGSLINMSFSALSRIERGEGSPNMKTINALTHFFNVTSDYLLGEDKEGFLLFYEEGDKTYCDMISEEELDKYIEDKEIEESVGPKNIIRTITSQKLIGKIKQSFYYGKDGVVHNIYLDNKKNTNKIDKDSIKFFDDESFKIWRAYMSLPQPQKKLVDDLILNLAGGNTRNG